MPHLYSPWIFFFIFLIGLALGSFTNVLIYRIPRSLPILLSRSHCPNCKHIIAWYDNIPLFSYLVLRGKCRHCKTPISVRYPLIELLVGLALIGLYIRFGFSSEFWALLLSTPILVALAFIDIEHRRLPDLLTFSFAFIGFVYRVTNGMLIDSLIGLMGGLLTGIAIYLVSKWAYGREALGFGDVKFLGSVGIWVGLTSVFIIIFLGALLGVLFSVWAVFKSKSLRIEVPFGPFLISAFYLTIFLHIDLWSLIGV